MLHDHHTSCNACSLRNGSSQLRSDSIMFSESGVLQLHLCQSSIQPYEGEVVWYCSECREGPMPNWQDACPCCYHQKCDSCTVVSTK
ncbi:hypothetical protein BKA66DRAFT_475278 [Pyrenochaeta sp. MPI-SDFR-AT-0127]|nr:hypothetical protein BKA66DRAFT_475278 [Pyrenochaeta sp. MPI-SDFR-AT-0127]